MKLSEAMRIAWEAILKNKVRSFLTMLGIIIGVAAVIIMVAISAGTEATIQEQITSLGSNLIFVQGVITRGGPGQAPSGGLVFDDAAAIAGWRQRRDVRGCRTAVQRDRQGRRCDSGRCEHPRHHHRLPLGARHGHCRGPLLHGQGDGTQDTRWPCSAPPLAADLFGSSTTPSDSTSRSAQPS